MSLAEITGIPRITVNRKLNYLIKRNILQINEKKLIILNISGVALDEIQELQNQNMKSLSNFIYRAFNQIKIII